MNIRVYSKIWNCNYRWVGVVKGGGGGGGWGGGGWAGGLRQDCFHQCLLKKGES